MESGRYPQFVRVITESTDDPDPQAVFERRLRYVLDGMASAFERVTQSARQTGPES
jgi:hypothetical protein